MNVVIYSQETDRSSWTRKFIWHD